MESSQVKFAPIICIDGPRKSRIYVFPVGTTQFQINSLVPGNDYDVYYGGRMSGYGGYIYKVFAFWGSGCWGATFDRLAYR